MAGAWRVVSKAFVWIACTAGFLYQASDVLQLYTRHAFTVTVYKEHGSRHIRFPAATICIEKCARCMRHSHASFVRHAAEPSETGCAWLRISALARAATRLPVFLFSDLAWFVGLPANSRVPSALRHGTTALLDYGKGGSEALAERLLFDPQLRDEAAYTPSELFNCRMRSLDDKCTAFSCTSMIRRTFYRTPFLMCYTFDLYQYSEPSHPFRSCEVPWLYDCKNTAFSQLSHTFKDLIFIADALSQGQTGNKAATTGDCCIRCVGAHILKASCDVDKVRRRAGLIFKAICDVSAMRYKVELTVAWDALNTGPTDNALKYPLIVHEPEVCPPEKLAPIHLRQGMRYTVSIAQVIFRRLPYPSASRCTDYRGRGRVGAYFGYMNYAVCLQDCLIQQELRTCGCAFHDHEFAATSFNGILCSSEKKSKCVKMFSRDLNYNICKERCSQPCSEITYDVKLTGLSDNEPGQNQSSFTARIRFATNSLTVYDYQRRLTEQEALAYIGGYLGIWLGVSLYSIYVVLETSLTAFLRNRCHVFKNLARA
ncbi:uncharacterized protein LOC142583533 [Dermacentor variabilis]|uniref:uncharacterized protein LOC142583533 n=1 Tax=Dermacentor variabilis TaxID=34621 RepID=UPI003F5BCDB7